MPESRHVQESLPLNGNRLNQAAKVALASLGADANPCYLYCVQLVEWMLDNRPEAVPSPADRFRHQMRDNLYLMADWEPEKAQRMLLNPDPSDQSDSATSTADEPSWMKHSPDDLAAILTEQFYDNLSNKLPALRNRPEESWE